MAIKLYKVDYNSWPIDWLANYIEKLQRKTVTEKSKAILRNIKFVKGGNADRYTDFVKIEKLFVETLSRLAAHMAKEERYLFPFIREMLNARESNRCLNGAALDRIACLIKLLNVDHAVERQQLKLSAVLRSDNLGIFKSGTTSNAFLSSLAEFEQACELHIYLQNKFLFPKIIAERFAVS